MQQFSLFRKMWCLGLCRAPIMYGALGRSRADVLSGWVGPGSHNLGPIKAQVRTTTNHRPTAHTVLTELLPLNAFFVYFLNCTKKSAICSKKLYTLYITAQ